MTTNALRRRLDRIDARRRYPGHCGTVHIVTEGDNDAAHQIAALAAAGRYSPGMLVIDRRIVDPSPRTLQ